MYSLNKPHLNANTQKCHTTKATSELPCTLKIIRSKHTLSQSITFVEEKERHKFRPSQQIDPNPILFLTTSQY